jgi:ABC-type transport system involved in cytochrome bd biosynthesis fused ATPase/permease subunit
VQKIGGESLNGLNSLEALDLSSNNISQIGVNAFEFMHETLRVLNLANNSLRTMDVGLLQNLTLTELDISNNKWLCEKETFKGEN